MRALLASIAFLVACGGPKHKDTTIVNEGSDVPQNCCCKTNPPSSEDGKPVYAMANRMECSTEQGACVDNVQCNASMNKDEPPSSTGVPPPPGAGASDPTAAPIPR